MTAQVQRLWRCGRGAAMMEFGLLTPVIASFIIAAIELGMVFLVTNSLQNAVLSSSRYGITGQSEEGITRKEKIVEVVSENTFGLINLDDPIALHVSAMGPKSRRLVAELGAGWLNFAGQESAAVRTLEDMQAAWADAGRQADDLYGTLFFLGAVLRDGEGVDSERVVAQAGPWVTVFFHNLVETTEPGSMESILGKDLSDRLEQYREVYQSYPAKRRHLHNHRGHLMFIRPDERFLVTPDLIESMTFTGDVETLQARVARLAEAGYRQLTVQIVEGQEDALEDWAAVFRL